MYKKLSVGSLLFLVALFGAAKLAEAQIGVPAIISATNQTSVRLGWFADPGQEYDVRTSSNLAAGTWTPAFPQPIAPTSLVGSAQVAISNRAQFFTVTKRDITPPQIVARYPATNGVGAAPGTPILIDLADETGVDTNAVNLFVPGGSVWSNGAVGVTATTNAFQLDPGTNTWGSAGATVTVAFVAVDVVGNAATSTWSFVLAPDAVVATNLVHVGGVQARASGLRSLAMPGVKFADSLTIVTFETNRIVFSYTGSAHGLYLGVVLVSHDPNRIFYRRITGLTDDAVNKLVTAYTVDVPLTDIVQDGAFVPEAFLPVGGTAQMLMPQVQMGVTMPFSYQGELSAMSFEWAPIRVSPSSIDCTLKGSLRLSCEINNWALQGIDAQFESDLDLKIRSSLEIFSSVDLFSQEASLIGGKKPIARVAGAIGPIPVWVDLNLDLLLAADVSAEGALAFETGLDAYANNRYAVYWRSDRTWQESSGDFHIVPVPLNIGFKISAEAYVYVKPQLSALVYSLAGVSADYRRGPCLEASWSPGDPQCEFGLYDKWSINGALTIVGFAGSLPKLTFIEEKRLLDRWYWPAVADVAPVFTRQPASVAVNAGGLVTLEAGASGSPAPTYQWYLENDPLAFKTAPTLSFTASAQTAGRYHALAVNRAGQAISSTATVTVRQPAPAGDYLVVDLSAGPSASSYPVSYLTGVPSGGWTDEYKTTKLVMRKIPATASAFTMGSPADELGRWSDETQHQVTLTQPFYIGVFEVTQKQWELVMGNKPSYFNNATYYATRPVECVSYYDIRENPANSDDPAVDWPANSAVNATSFMGKLRSKTGLSGFDLPTESQWEYACRAGTGTALNSGKNLTSTDQDANMAEVGRYWYNGPNSYGYAQSVDTSGGTANVGSYLANQWGLYDMHGNVWEWCLDWYGTYPGTVSEPRGAASGSFRVSRGGSWLYFARYCRSAYRGNFWPAFRGNGIGFRAARTLP